MIIYVLGQGIEMSKTVESGRALIAYATLEEARKQAELIAQESSVKTVEIRAIRIIMPNETIT